jgi:Family of unknown function (DUF5989)
MSDKLGRVGRWWIRPLLLAVIGLAILIFLTKGKTLVPFVYTIF